MTKQPFAVLLGIFFLLMLADESLTLIAVKKGVAERNPLSLFSISIIGDVAFKVAGTIVIILLLRWVWTKARKGATALAMLLIMVMFGVVLRNTYVVFFT